MTQGERTGQRAAVIHAAEMPLAKIFGDDYQFAIPPYQRPYSWEEEHVQQLFDDLLDASVRDGANDVKRLDPYFLGSIVLVKADGDPGSEVVDGQQRLTTLALFIAALKHRLGDRGKPLEDFLWEEGNPYRGTEDRCRLRPRPRDAEIFEGILRFGGLPEGVNRARLPETQARLLSAYDLLSEACHGVSDDGAHALGQYVLQRCFLVVVATSAFDAAFRIFSVLNDRGMDLSTTDILKAELIGSLPSGRQDEYTKKWEDVEESLGRDQFMALFSHIRMIHRRTKLRNLLKEMKDQVLPRYGPDVFVDDQVIPYSDVLLMARESTFRAEEGAESVNRSLRFLRLIDNSDWYPVAMELLRRLGDADQGRLDALLRHLERLAASMMIRRVYVNARIDRYGSILEGFDRGVDLLKEDSALQLSAREREDTIEQLDGDIYLSTRVRLPVLLRLDQLLSDQVATYDVRTTTIEHVLPQKPPVDSEWCKLFPDEEHREAWTNRLGNLVLLSRRKNSQAQNLPFTVKKERYFSPEVSSFALTTGVLEKQEWTPGVLEERHKKLLGRLISEWRL